MNKCMALLAAALFVRTGLTGVDQPASWQGRGWRGDCPCPFTDTVVLVKLGLSFPISFWAVSPQARGKGEVKTQEEMSLPIEV